VELLKSALRECLARSRQQLRRIGGSERELARLTVRHVASGSRGLPVVLCDTSEVTPDDGLFVRGRPIAEAASRTPEELFWLLLTGDWPDAQQAAELGRELACRCRLPDYLWRVLEALPADTHPMAQLNTGVLALQPNSIFARRYAAGLPPDRFWEATLEDALNLLAQLPCLAGYIYRRRTRKGAISCCEARRDWAGGYAHMLGLPDPHGRLAAALRLLCVVHGDHGGGNVSSLAAAVVNSSLADIYLALSAGLNGLAGPLDGLASQESVYWLRQVAASDAGPDANVWRRAVDERLAARRPIPGFGHAVLRCVDPRYRILADFARRECPEAPLVRAALAAAEHVPALLREKTRTRNPNPNVDLISGPLMDAFGIAEPEYHAVLISVGRALGLCAQAVLARGLGLPIFRPDSITLQRLAAGTDAGTQA